MSIFLVMLCTRAELIQVYAAESYGTTLETGSVRTNVTYTLYDNNAGCIGDILVFTGTLIEEYEVAEKIPFIAGFCKIVHFLPFFDFG